MLETGMVLKGVGGFYTVHLERGPVITCTPRGRFKKDSLKLAAGDRVRITHDGRVGVIEEIFPRSTELYRPAIANAEQVVIVVAVKNPDLNLFLLDRLLVMAEAASMEVLICFNKMDLIQSREVREITGAYREIGYRVLESSALLSQGIEEIRGCLAGKISVVAGPSGAGKSTLLNRLFPLLKLKTSGISRKLKGGRHTTRQVELIPLDSGGFVADTPGFSQLTVRGITGAELPYLFPEVGRLGESCRFRGCLHIREPGCAVRDALETGDLFPSRYQNYAGILREIQEEERRY